MLVLESDVVTGDLPKARGGSRGSLPTVGDCGGESSANGIRRGDAFA